MADNFLITGYWGEPHVTAENDRGINAATFGAGRFVLPVGEQFRAEYIGNNTIRMYDGKLMDNGAAAGIPAGEYVDLLISNASQGMKRNDIIAFQYEQDASTLIESGKFVVIQGAETSGTASDPELTENDLLSGKAVFDQMALWRVPISGATISAPVQMFSTIHLLSVIESGESGVWNYEKYSDGTYKAWASFISSSKASTSPQGNVHMVNPFNVQAPDFSKKITHHNTKCSFTATYSWDGSWVPVNANHMQIALFSVVAVTNGEWRFVAEIRGTY